MHAGKMRTISACFLKSFRCYSRKLGHHDPTICQTLTEHVSYIFALLKDRDTFARLVREVAEPDVAHMGIEILSFTIKDIFDKVEYLDSLGKGQVALVKRDAQIGVAEAERDAGLQVSCYPPPRTLITPRIEVSATSTRCRSIKTATTNIRKRRGCFGSVV